MSTRPASAWRPWGFVNISPEVKTAAADVEFLRVGNWHSAPGLLRLILVAMVGALMSLNAVGEFGFLTRAHLDHMVAADLMLADRTADIEARVTIQGQTVADLDRRFAQIDAAIEESTRLGRPVGA
jgi:hypothetical protein